MKINIACGVILFTAYNLTVYIVIFKPYSWKAMQKSFTAGMKFDINVWCMTALFLIKPCNISPRRLFVPTRQLMRATLSQQETKGHAVF